MLTHPDHANRGVEESARLGISHARGRFLLGLASDDMLYPTRSSRAPSSWSSGPEVGFVYGYADLIDESGRRLRQLRTFGIDLTRAGAPSNGCIQGNTIPSMTAMLRRECLEQTGCLDPRLVYSDWDLFARARGTLGRRLHPACAGDVPDPPAQHEHEATRRHRWFAHSR